ncbi:unnamed protein product [Prorocentrum cordatum]|uniref:Uncharacterized protein n=1 Tax=Prorocentrum cordatum TaxID=2364126 RepID=A0ABN9WBH2_9DINO|nr:unnamed protein product [Polarella glacialis]
MAHAAARTQTSDVVGALSIFSHCGSPEVWTASSGPAFHPESVLTVQGLGEGSQRPKIGESLRGFHLDERMSEKGRAMADPHRGELGSAPLAARAPLRVRSSASSAPPAVAPTAAFGAARFSVRRGARARSAEAPVDVSAAVAAAVSAATAAAWPQPGAAGRRVEEPQQPGRCPSAAAAPSQQLQQPSRGCGGPAPALRLLEPPSTPSPRARTAGAAQRLDGSTAARPALPGAGARNGRGRQGIQGQR